MVDHREIFFEFSVLGGINKTLFTYFMDISILSAYSKCALCMPGAGVIRREHWIPATWVLETKPAALCMCSRCSQPLCRLSGPLLGIFRLSTRVKSPRRKDKILKSMGVGFSKRELSILLSLDKRIRFFH